MSHTTPAQVTQADRDLAGWFTRRMQDGALGEQGMNLISRWIARYRAKRQHRRLLNEARNDWRIVGQSSESFVYCWGNGEAGTLAFVGEENALGERRLRVVHPDREKAKAFLEASKAWPAWKLWQAKAQPKSIPMKEIA